MEKWLVLFVLSVHSLQSVGLSVSLDIRFGSASPKVHYSEGPLFRSLCAEACVLYKLAEACYISVTGTNPNPKRPTTPHP